MFRFAVRGSFDAWIFGGGALEPMHLHIDGVVIMNVLLVSDGDTVRP